MGDDETTYETVRGAILDAAAGVFEKLGFDRTTVNDIAAAVYKAKSSLYYYYKSKEDIFLEIVQQETQSMMTELSQAVQKEPDAVGKLRAYVVTRIGQLQTLPNLRSVLADGYLKKSRLFEDAQSRFAQTAGSMLGTILAEGKRVGILEFGSVEAATTRILAAIKGLELSVLLDDEESDPLADIDDLVGMIVNGLRKR